MRVSIALCLFGVFAFANARCMSGCWSSGTWGTKIGEIGHSLQHLVIKNGYRVENYTVETSDGYLLDLIRIPHGRIHVPQPGYPDVSFSSASSDEESDASQDISGLNNVDILRNSIYDPKLKNLFTQLSNDISEESQEYRQRKQNGEQTSYSQKWQQQNSMLEELALSQSRENRNKPAVLLMPGFMSTFESFLAGGPSQGLAFNLADAGYDVYMGNVRGSVHGLRHTRLNAHKDAQFWKFSVHEKGVKDMSAIIDEVLKISEQEKIYLVGHQEGATAFLVLASEKPEYNDKIKKMFALAPVAYMKNSQNKYIKKILQKFQEHSEIPLSEMWGSAYRMRLLGRSVFRPSFDLQTEMQETCLRTATHGRNICRNTYFQFVGHNSDDLNMRAVKNMPHIPSPVSARDVMHLAQLMDSGRFQKYNSEYNGKDFSHEEYDLSSVEVPTVVLYAPHDPMASTSDVERLIQDLPNVKHSMKLRTISNGVDMVFSKNVDTKVNEIIIDIMKKVEGRAQ